MFFFNTNTQRLREIYEVKNDVKVFAGEIAGLKRRKKKQKTKKKLLNCYKCKKMCEINTKIFLIFI